MNPRFALALVVVTLAAFLGCASKVTKENHDQLKGGMTIAEVESLLGQGQEEKPPSGSGPTAKAMSWRSGNFTINVEFRDGKLHAQGFRGS